VVRYVEGAGLKGEGQVERKDVFGPDKNRMVERTGPGYCVAMRVDL
jgi:hypothetical protein